LTSIAPGRRSPWQNRIAHTKAWCGLSFAVIVPTLSRDGLQTEDFGFNTDASLMNDFPTMEDPAAQAAAETIWSFSRGEGTNYTRRISVRAGIFADPGSNQT
jgi:hypothetical protein